MSGLRLAVVGTGHLGRIHAKLIGQLDSAELTAVVDPDAARCQSVADEFFTTAARHHSELYDKIDAAIVAAPNAAHTTIGTELLQHGVHVLMEKPLATTVAESDQLIAAAEKSGCILQVGHVERFNPAFQAAADHISHPKYIEARRTSGYPARSTDIGAVLDLMIHDLDLVLHLAHSEVRNVSALGASILGGHEDMAQARVEFVNGCVADLVASRVSFEVTRSMGVYCRSGFASIDFQNRTAQIVCPDELISNGSLVENQPTAAQQAELSGQLYQTLLQRSELEIRDTNAILEEQKDFLSAIHSGRSPQVSGHDGRDAVMVAERILECIEQHQWNGVPAGPVGPHAEPATPILRPQLWPSATETRKAS
jgi:predicted dehydrogenase